MIKRIVKLSFQEEKTEAFLAIFKATKDSIRSFPGCSHLELWNQLDEPNVFFTYSYWESEEALDAYRQSDLFAATWAKTKVLFNDRPQAWSVEEVRPADEL
jgi:quinol monooxygenase YgiN